MTTVHLVFPPTWPTDAPYLSLPALSAYLRSRTDATVRAYDLNIAFWMDLRSEENLERLWRWLCDRVGQTVTSRSAVDLDVVLRLSRVAGMGLEGFLRAVRTGELSRDHIDSMLCLQFTEERIRPNALVGPPLKDHGYFDPDPLSDAISLAEEATSAERIMASLSGDSPANPYLDIMPRLYARATAGERPDVLGLSVTGPNQVIPAFALARWVKMTFPATTVLVGGAWTTHVLDRPDALEPLFVWVDGFVAGGGELPLAEAVRRIRAGAPLPGIPAVFTPGRGCAPPSVHAHWDVMLDELPTPDFDDLPLHSYGYPGLFPLQASRGCSWGHCSFCSYVTLDPVYRVRAGEKIVSDIEALTKRYPLREVAFTDSLMEPAYFASVSEGLVNRMVHVKWRGFGRFDRHYSRQVLCLMARAGCHLIIWGMESASPRILKTMRKGTTTTIIQANLRDAATAGIHNRVCLIYGYPGETGGDREATIAFIRCCKDWIHSVAFCEYAAVRNTPMTRAPDSNLLAFPDDAAPLALKMGRVEPPAQYLVETEQILRMLCLEVERHHTRIVPTSEPASHKCAAQVGDSATGDFE